MSKISKQQPMREAEIALLDFVNETDFALTSDVETAKSELKTDINKVQQNLDTFEDVTSLNLDNIITNMWANHKEVKTLINDETTRAKSAESALKTSLNSEIERAKSAESEIDSKFANYATKEDVETEVSEILPITNDKLETDSVTSSKIKAGAVNETKIGDNSISESKMKENSVNTRSIVENAVTLGKLDSSIQEQLSFLQTLPDFEWGYSEESYTLNANSTQDITITFKTTKTEAPSLFITVQQNSVNPIEYYVKWTTTTQANFVIINNNSEAVQNITYDYLAISGR